MTYFRDSNIAGRLALGSEPELNSGCILWSGSMCKQGYGKLSVKGMKRGVHRLSYALAYGPIPDGQNVCHRCDTPACLNPAHLFLGTQAENLADMEAKGRGNKPCGESHPNAKLRSDDVLKIKGRLAAGERTASIAADYGVTRTAIYAIRQGIRWADTSSRGVQCPA